MDKDGRIALFQESWVFSGPAEIVMQANMLLGERDYPESNMDWSWADMNDLTTFEDYSNVLIECFSNCFVSSDKFRLCLIFFFPL